jgi:hypothetical protein
MCHMCHLCGCATWPCRGIPRALLGHFSSTFDCLLDFLLLSKVTGDVKCRQICKMEATLYLSHPLSILRISCNYYYYHLVLTLLMHMFDQPSHRRPLEKGTAIPGISKLWRQISTFETTVYKLMINSLVTGIARTCLSCRLSRENFLATILGLKCNGSSQAWLPL